MQLIQLDPSLARSSHTHCRMYFKSKKSSNREFSSYYICDVKIKSRETRLSSCILLPVTTLIHWRMRATRNEARRAALLFMRRTMLAHMRHVCTHVFSLHTYTYIRACVYNTVATQRRHVIGPVLSRGLASRLV